METVTPKSPSATGLTQSVGQSLLSFSFNLGGLLTGTLLVLYFNVFSIKEAPWALILFPGILSIRGAIGGLFSGHLSTGLHLGTVNPSFTKNTRDFQLLIKGVVTLALVSGIAIGIGTSLLGVILWKATLMDFIKLLAVVVATMALSVVFISPLTMAFSVLSFRRGLDPDVIVYPMISTLADIINTACYIFSLSLFFTVDPFGHYFIGILDLVFLSIAVCFVVKNLKEEVFSKMIREFLVTLIFVAFIVNVTGSFLHEISGIVGDRTEIYVVYPALITTVGGVGAIVGSTATTKLALGANEPTFSSIKEQLKEIGGSWIASLVMFTIYLIISSLTSGMFVPSALPKYAARLLATNIIAVSAMVTVSYAVAIYTYRRGWDPDNFVIPIESSLADSVTTISFLMALSAIA